MRRSDPAPEAFSVSASDHKPLRLPAKSRVVQFDWSRRWKRDVVPHLGMPVVRASVEVGMRMYDPAWSWDDGPHAIGRGRWNGQRVVEGKLSWYQPWGRCHWISFFARAVGVLNYPNLDWQFVSGHCHTVSVGSRGGRPGVVMDILNFKGMTAEESLAHARYVPPGQEAEAAPGWAKLFGYYVTEFVPVLRKMTC